MDVEPENEVGETEGWGKGSVGNVSDKQAEGWIVGGDGTDRVPISCGPQTPVSMGVVELGKLGSAE